MQHNPAKLRAASSKCKFDDIHSSIELPAKFLEHRFEFGKFLSEFGELRLDLGQTINGGR